MEKATKSFFSYYRRGVGDKPMACKPGVAGSIPSFSIKPLLVEPSGAPVIKYTHQIHKSAINHPGPELVTTHRKATKSF